MSHATAARPLEIVAMDFTQIEKSTQVLKMFLYLQMSSQNIPLPYQHVIKQQRQQADFSFENGLKNLAYLNVYTYSNQSSSFENQIIKQLCLLYQVKKSKTTPYHPRGNGKS